MDPYAGNLQEPATLHRYLYAGANPVINVDPSGEFFSLGSLTTSLGIMGTLSSIALPSYAGAAALKIPLLSYPASKEQRQLAGLIYAESSSKNVGGGEFQDEKIAIGYTVENRAYYGKIKKAMVNGQMRTCYNQAFGAGDVWSAISYTNPKQFEAYNGPQWRKVMVGDDLQPYKVLDNQMYDRDDRIHFNMSLIAARLIDPSQALFSFSSFNNSVPVGFNKAPKTPPSGRMNKIGSISVHSFYGFITGRECD